jgi:nucleoside-diphosphate-sugar epimerase
LSLAKGETASVLVTGGTSQIGFFALPVLREAGYVVHAVSRQRQSSPDVTWWQWDLRALPDELPALPETLIHLAGLPDIMALLKHPAAQKIRRVIAFSSSSRFSKETSPNPAERQVAQTLAEAEAQLIAHCEHRAINWTLFRPTLIYGCGRDQNISFIIRMIERFGFFPLLGEGKGLRQPVHAQDLAQACALALENSTTYGKSYTLSGGETLSYRAMVTAVFLRLGKKPRIITLPAGLLKPAVSLLSYLPGFRHVSPSMLDRMNADLCFSHAAARQDFAYAPRQFSSHAVSGVSGSLGKGFPKHGDVEI